jgi:hypothetical protein
MKLACGRRFRFHTRAAPAFGRDAGQPSTKIIVASPVVANAEIRPRELGMPSVSLV